MLGLFLPNIKIVSSGYIKTGYITKYIPNGLFLNIDLSESTSAQPPAQHRNTYKVAAKLRLLERYHNEFCQNKAAFYTTTKVSWGCTAR